MKIRLADRSREARPVHGGGRPDPTYRCFTKTRARDENGKLSNQVVNETPFQRVEDAAQFLINNPGTGIRMQPGSRVMYRNIVVALDEN